MLSIILDNVSKSFNKKIAVDSVRLEIESGAFFGFLGPNGAGKTTTIRMIAGLLTPDSGKILLNGREIDIHEKEWKRQIGLLSDDVGFFYRLTLWEHLLFVGQLYGLSYEETTSRAEELLNFLDAWDARDTKAFQASHGTKKKLSLALSLIHNPGILLMDEPFEGIDFVTAKKIRELLSTLSMRGKTVFITSHILEVVERIIGPFAVISEGRIVHRSTMSDLKASNKTLPEVYTTLVGGPSSNTGSEPRMDQLRILLSYQWKMYLRCLEVNSLRKTERFLASWIAFVIFIRYFVNTVFIISTFGSENAAFALPMLEFNMLYVGIILVIGPFLLRTVLATGYSLNAPRLLLLSVSASKLFILKITEIIFRPSFIVMFACSIFSVSAFLFTPHPAAGMISGFFYIMFCISVSLLLTTIGADVMENRTVKGASSIVLVAFALVILNMNYSFLIGDGNLYTWAGTNKVLLWNQTTGGGFLSDIHLFAPSSWVMRSISGDSWFSSVVIFAISIPVFIAASMFIYGRSIAKTPTRKRYLVKIKRNFKPISFSGGQTGIILKKHFFQICSEPIYLFCSAVTIILGILLFLKNESLDGAFIPLLFIVLIIESRLFFNIFGYETLSLDRYRLAPIRGVEILAAKNGALLIAMFCQYLPFFIMSLIATDFTTSMALLLISGIVWIVYTIWGNVSSLLLITPSVMTDETSPPTYDKFINVCVSIVPLFVINYFKGLLSSAPPYIQIIAEFVFFCICIIVYRLLIARQGMYLENKIEEVVLELSNQ